MTGQSKRERFVERYLDPASRLGEVLFGLIMVLGATLTAGLDVPEGKAGVRRLLYAALGCNMAWGIIDGVMYVMNCMTVRAEKARLIDAIQRAHGAFGEATSGTSWRFECIGNAELILLFTAAFEDAQNISGLA